MGAVRIVVGLLGAVGLLGWQPRGAMASQEELPLFWEYATPYYQVVLSLDPVGFDSFGIDPGGQGRFREVLAYSGKPSSLWVGIGGWGTHSPGPASSLEVTQTPLGPDLTIRGIPMVGILPHNLSERAPVSADWAFRFRERCFAFQVTWHVPDGVEGLQEAGWAFNLDLPRYGDDGEMARQPGDVHGYPNWIAWYDDRVAVVAVYAGGARSLQANRWYGSHETAYVIVHTWWDPGGVDIDWGSYPGGWWRVAPLDMGK